MGRYEDRLWSDLVQEHGRALAVTERPEPRRAGGAGLLRRPRVVAGSTLGLAGVGVAVVLTLGAASSPPAYAVTTNSDGSVTVQINEETDLPQANAKLLSMGTGEQVTIYMARGAATVSGAVACTPQSGETGPPVKVLVGKDGTEVIAPGQSADNTGEGTFHLDRCTVASADDTGPGTGNSGNTGAG